MAQIINTNLISQNAQRNLSTTNSSLSTAIQRLSSGLRVNSAKDDAAGLAIAEGMSAQVRGMNVAIRNANDGISMAQTADGALSQIAEMAQRMRELAVQGANGTNTNADRAKLQTEFAALQAEITRTVASTTFNGTAILGAAAATGVKIQVGAGTTTNVDDMTIAGADLTAAASAVKVAATGGATGVFIQDGVTNGSTAAITAIDAMLTEVNTQRAVYGAAQNRLSATIATLQVSVESQSAARSRIMDADFAAETANLTRAQVLQQAGTAMLSQANQVPNGVLKLLQG